MLEKEFKQFIRKKSNIIMLFVFPIVLITTLALGLKDLMSGNMNIFGNDNEKSIVYYSIYDDSKYKEGFLTFKDTISEEISIEFKEESLENVKDEIDSYDAIAFVEVNNDGFSIYTSKKGDNTEMKIFKQIMDNALNNFAAYETIAKKNPKDMMNLSESNVKEILSDATKNLRNSSSAEYYTFAELALIILFISTITAQSTYKEKELITINRIKLSKVSEQRLIFTKVFFGCLIGIVQTILVWAYSSIFLNVNWGENTIKFILLYIALSLFASMGGVVLGIICKNSGTFSGILNGAIIVICALGGCYTPLYTITSSEVMATICKVSPIYWINIATNSMICDIKTNSYIVALLIPLVLSAIMFFIYLAINKKRRAL